VVKTKIAKRTTRRASAATRADLIAETDALLGSDRLVWVYVSYHGAQPHHRPLEQIRRLVGDAGFFIGERPRRMADGSYTEAAFEFTDARDAEDAIDRLADAGFGCDVTILGYPTMLFSIQQVYE